MRKKTCEVGRKFHKLTVIEVSIVKDCEGSYQWICKCDCGTTISVSRYSLRKGLTRSCGCLQKQTARDVCESRTKHAQARRNQHTPTYKSWRYMRDRVARDSDYAHVSISSSWDNFDNFLRDMGEKPVGKTLDRINNFKPYAKGNCRWATPAEQARNKTDNVVFKFQGKPRTLPEIAEITGINYKTLYSRIK